MNRKTINDICATFPGAEVSDPWGGGHDAWKVGGKMFASLGAVLPGVSVKTSKPASASKRRTSTAPGSCSHSTPPTTSSAIASPNPTARYAAV